MSFLLEDYNYDLPPELIAQHPITPRDHSRLMVIHRPKDAKPARFEHRRFDDLLEYVQPTDHFVANNTRVIPARLIGQRLLQSAEQTTPEGSRGQLEALGGKVEFLLLDEIEPCVWEGAFHAAAKHKPGVRFRIPTPDGRGLTGELIRGASDSPSGTVVARFDRDPLESGAGEVPLPHYIERGGQSTGHAEDQERYQTVYAVSVDQGKKQLSAAAPTAGLHFTRELIERLRARGASWNEISLQVGLGTFRPVKTEDVRDHVMHEERFVIDPGTASAITEAKSKESRVIAVGTTSLRALESAWEGSRLLDGVGRTSIFFYPGGQPIRLVDALVTNFHLPKSTLLMLVSAFAGREHMLAAYREAVREKYRFFSYGDAMVIL